MLNPNWITVIVAFISVLLGGLITWRVSQVYYKKAGDELRSEAKSLHLASAAIIYVLKHSNAEIEVELDAEGHLVTAVCATGESHGTAARTRCG